MYHAQMRMRGYPAGWRDTFFYDGISLFAVSKKICLFAIFNYILVKKCDKIFGEAEYQC